MTIQGTAPVRPGKAGLRAQLTMTALTLAAVAGFALWQVRPNADVAPSDTSAALRTIGEGAAPRGGLAELHAARQAEASALAELEGRMGGMAELYRDQARERGASMSR